MKAVFLILGAWLQHVFKICIEGKEELACGHDSLVFMDQAATTLDSSGCRFGSPPLASLVPFIYSQNL